MAKEIITIPQTKNRVEGRNINIKTRRVAAYARVSTDLDEQVSSYEAQIDYYSKYILARPDWVFVKVYTDEGITGTSMKKREGFKEMVADALAGKIDLIITKSVSRFARNTVDSLTTVRKLKEKGVEVYFEKENIWTLDSKGELLITIMSSLAQEESRSISENTTWGKRKQFQDGKFSMPYSSFLGYDKGPDGTLVVNKEEAKTIKRIYQLCLEGYTAQQSARILTAEGYRTPKGQKDWCRATVKSILTNEKYKGDALLQKGYTEDFLTKKYVKNNGEVPQYYVTGCHEAIIEPEVFDYVQLLVKNMEGTQRRLSDNPLSHRIICGECGGFYGHKIWGAGTPYRKEIYQCNDKYRRHGIPGTGCKTPHVYPDQIKALVVKRINEVIVQKEDIIENYTYINSRILDTTELEQEKLRITIELSRLAPEMDRMVKQNSSEVQDQTEYNIKFKSLSKQYEEATNRLKEIDEEIEEKSMKKISTDIFLNDLKQQTELLTEFDERIFRRLVDVIIVERDGTIKVRFRNGIEL